MEMYVIVATYLSNKVTGMCTAGRIYSYISLYERFICFLIPHPHVKQINKLEVLITTTHVSWNLRPNKTSVKKSLCLKRY
jgi:hypothetical protein